eukprot:GHVL01005727.1.p1 GENE.GHVL01005727.1~~GHVL01005727.1.p1  ORF type:complete len:429 (+),score=53.52 GHVL01005727.1:2019-3305(+)
MYPSSSTKKHQSCCLQNISRAVWFRGLSFANIYNGGLESFPLLFYSYYENRDIVWTAIDCVERVFELETIPRCDLTRTLARSGVCLDLAIVMELLAGDYLFDYDAKHYLEKVLDIILIFSEADSVVKKILCQGEILQALILAVEYLSPQQLCKLCRVLKHLCLERDVVGVLENAGVVPVLVHLLGVVDIRNQALHALFQLLRLSKARQEQAAIAGVVPFLMKCVGENSKLKGFSYQLICELALTSCVTRDILWSHGALSFFVKALHEPYWQTTALEALVHWLCKDSRVENILKNNIYFMNNLKDLFCLAYGEVFLKILDPILKIAIESDGLCKCFEKNITFMGELVSRLRLFVFREVAEKRALSIGATCSKQRNVLVTSSLMKILAAICKKSSNPHSLDKIHHISSLARCVIILQDERVILVYIYIYI